METEARTLEWMRYLTGGGECHPLKRVARVPHAAARRMNLSNNLAMMSHPYAVKAMVKHRLNFQDLGALTFVIENGEAYLDDRGGLCFLLEHTGNKSGYFAVLKPDRGKAVFIVRTFFRLRTRCGS